MSSAPKKKFFLQCSDRETSEVHEALAIMSPMIKNWTEDPCSEEMIPLPSIPSKILTMVIGYCKKHMENLNSSSELSEEDRAKQDEELKGWEADFVKVDRKTLYDLILAAQYLKIESLIDLTCRAEGNLIEDKSTDVEEVRRETVMGLSRYI